MTEPQLVRVLGLGRFRRATRVRVRVDNAGHDIGPVRIDFTGCVLGALFLVNVETRVTNTDDIHNTIALDHDIDRPYRWGACAIDERGPTDNKAVEWPFTFSAVRGRDHLG